MGTREILTLQLGHYANFVGTHWWNMQELNFNYSPNEKCSEINNDVLFREGRTLKGETTFTPRLLLADLKGSLKTLKETGDLYENEEETCVESQGGCSHEGIDVVHQPKAEKNDFQRDLEDINTHMDRLKMKIYDLEKNVGVWSDFMYSRYHPRTVNVINEYKHENAEAPFGLHPMGRTLWQTEFFREDFNDKIRNYVEECDMFEGFQVLFDSTDGFGGLTAACIQNLRDEYESKSILGLPVAPFADWGAKNTEKLVNLAMSFEALNEHSSHFIPLSVQTRGLDYRQFPGVSYTPDLNYHSSAVLATFLEAFSTIYRLKETRRSLREICQEFSAFGRTMGAAGLTYLTLPPNMDLIDFLDTKTAPLVTSLTPNCEIPGDNVIQALGVRGLEEKCLKRPRGHPDAPRQQKMGAYQCDSIKDMLEFYYCCLGYLSKTDVTVCHEGVSTKTPFPRILPESAAVLGGLHSGEFLHEMLTCFTGAVNKVRFNKLDGFQGAGLEKDEFSETLAKMLDLRDCYSPQDCL